LHQLEIRNLSVGGGSVDLVIRRHTNDVGIDIVRRQGDIEIAVML
jgi:hypothetical protein